MTRRASFAFVLALAVVGAARAADVRPLGPPAPAPTPAPSSEPWSDAAPANPTPASTPLPAAPPRDEAEPEPYTHGWHAGTPPGDLFHVRLEYWLVDTKRGAAMEFDHQGRRVGALHAHSLGYSDQQPLWRGSIELDFGDYGWYSFDYWQLVLTRNTHRITDGDHIFVDTLFPQGDVIQSRVEQHYAIARDGVDVRYRFPLGEGSALDLSFGPVLSLAMRYESMDVNSIVGPRSDGSHFFALSLVPGLRLGLDLHATPFFTVRVGADIDWLPELPHTNPLSFTREPSIRLWHDVRSFVAVRVFFVEVDAGYRFFEVYSGQGNTGGGGRLREGIDHMQGFDCGVSLAF